MESYICEALNQPVAKQNQRLNVADKGKEIAVDSAACHANPEGKPKKGVAIESSILVMPPGIASSVTVTIVSKSLQMITCCVIIVSFV
ncbi:unnamed protein product [Arabis nemorensis]|uniref:Uncharacterized protein n=1 Tax=Arabis nemorensis TaxID=586526 RepID=A0A565AU23_9BRAS|nr:unnamed protein product [Arabis nemorensis]